MWTFLLHLYVWRPSSYLANIGRVRQDNIAFFQMLRPEGFYGWARTTQVVGLELEDVRVLFSRGYEKQV